MSSADFFIIGRGQFACGSLHSSHNTDDFADNGNAGVDFDGRITGVGRLQIIIVAAPPEVLDGRLIIDKGDDRFSGLGHALFAHQNQVVGHDTGPGHAVTFDPQSKGAFIGKNQAVQVKVSFDLLHGQVGKTRLDPS